MSNQATESVLSLSLLFSHTSLVFANQPKVGFWQRLLDVPQVRCFFFLDSFLWLGEMIGLDSHNNSSGRGVCSFQDCPIKILQACYSMIFPSHWLDVDQGEANEVIEGTWERPRAVNTAFWKCLNTHLGLLSEQEGNFCCLEHGIFRSVCSSH